MSAFNNVIFSRSHYTPHYSTPYRIERLTIHLKDLGTTATIYPITNVNQVPNNLINFLAQEYNDEILRGDTLPFFEQLNIEEFQNYWFGQFTAIMCIGDEPDLNYDEISVNDWAKKCLGSFFIKSAYPGRCSHICTTNFLVNAGIRQRGIGYYLCECFIRWAPTLGYSKCIIELIFETNLGGKKLLEKCGFSKVGKVQSCAILKSTKDLLISSYIFTKDLAIIKEDLSGSKHSHILTYLLSGQYPANSTRQDRSRLRSAAYNYEVINSKLYLRGREVIGEQDEQIRITQEIHEYEHTGVNRTTKLVSNKYYWPRIKSTVKKVIEDCEFCKESHESSKGSKKRKILNNNRDVLSNHSININKINNNNNNIINNNINNTMNNNIINNDTITVTTHPNTIESIQEATRLDTEQIETPRESLLKQSDNVLMNFMDLNTNSVNQQSTNRITNDNIGNNNDLNNPGSRDSTDFVSMLNYYNNADNNISITRNSSKRTNQIPFGSLQQDQFTNSSYYNDANNQFTSTNYAGLVQGDDEEDEEDDDDYDEAEEEEEEDDDDDDDGEGEEEDNENGDDEDDDDDDEDDEDDEDDDVFGEEAEEDNDAEDDDNANGSNADIRSG
jgi:GNAT superfamily N-acetyltransferase